MQTKFSDLLRNVFHAQATLHATLRDVHFFTLRSRTGLSFPCPSLCDWATVIIQSRG